MEIVSIRRRSFPCGEMILGAVGNWVCLCDWDKEERREKIDKRIRRQFNAVYVDESSQTIDKLIGELDEYFRGERKSFDMPLCFVGTEFQRLVWNELMKIPYGETISYGELARRIGKPSAVRAVASACGNNAISILVPCHRVIGGDGSLTGYAGGIDVKRYLLDREK